MIVLGLDAGLTIGFAVIDADAARGTGRHIASGVLPREEDPRETAARIDEVLGFYPGVELVAVELPARVLPRLARRNASAAHLVNATQIGGELAGHLRARGYRVHTLDANDWRGPLGCLKGDAYVARAIRLRIPDWPARSPNHARDAAGAALFVAMRETLPSPIRGSATGP